jgi:hypothetical protein
LDRNADVGRGGAGGGICLLKDAPWAATVYKLQNALFKYAAQKSSSHSSRPVGARARGETRHLRETREPSIVLRLAMLHPRDDPTYASAGSYGRHSQGRGRGQRWPSQLCRSRPKKRPSPSRHTCLLSFHSPDASLLDNFASLE